MNQRLMMALGVLLIAVRSTCAQPLDAGKPLPPASNYQGPVSTQLALPGDWSRPNAGGGFWISGEYLFSFVRGSNLPALVTTSDPGTSRINAGVLGASTTTTLFGDSWVNDALRSGFRVGTGFWFNAERTLGVEAGFMVLKGQAVQFDSGDGIPILARPFINGFNSAPSALLLAFPGSSTGSATVRADSSNFYEAHVGLAEKALDDSSFRLTSLFGYRYYRYDEGVQIGQIINTSDPNFAPGLQAVANDRFNTRNEFHGLDIGFRSQFFWDTFSVDVLTKLAVGRLNRSTTISGDQTITAPGIAPVVQAAGLLAGGTNSGTFNSSDWKAMPEAGAAVSWQVRPNVNLRVGYSFLFLNGVARAADQIDTTVNPNLLPGGNAALGGPSRPMVRDIHADMWIQSISVGLQWTY